MVLAVSGISQKSTFPGTNEEQSHQHSAHLKLAEYTTDTEREL